MSDMKRFNALKKVRAKPMSRQEYNDLRCWDLPADEDGSDKGYLVEDINAPANTDGYSGYVSWTPNDIFEDQFYEADDRQVQVGECTAPKDKPSVIGYRKLSDTEIALMNKIKAKGAEIGELVAELQSIDDLDQRAIAIGKAELQTGLMWLVRGVAQPESF